MSENSKEANTPKTADSSAPSEKSGSGSATQEKPSKRSLFGNLNVDLKQALDSWDTLSEEVSLKTAPDEKQLSEVKKLLQELKAKLNQFND